MSRNYPWGALPAARALPRNGSWISRCPAWRPCVVLRQGVGNVKPGCLGCDKDVLSRTNTGIRIERPQRYLAQPAVRGNSEAGAAGSAECPTDGRRCFVNAQVILARQPAKVFCSDLGIGPEGRPMKSPTHGAMAVANLSQWAVNLVANCAAEAPTLKLRGSRVSRRHKLTCTNPSARNKPIESTYTSLRATRLPVNGITSTPLQDTFLPVGCTESAPLLYGTARVPVAVHSWITRPSRMYVRRASKQISGNVEKTLFSISRMVAFPTALPPLV